MMNNTTFPRIDLTPLMSHDMSHNLASQYAYHVGSLEGFLKYYVAYGDIPGIKVTNREALKKHIDEKLEELQAKAKAKYPVA